MTFDMTKCKVGDKLRTRGKGEVEYTSYDSKNHPYCWWINNKVSINGDGCRYGVNTSDDYDIMGFWEEEPAEQPLTTITHNLTIKGHTHVLTTEELGGVYRLIDETLGGI